MRIQKYTKEQIEFVRQAYKEMSLDDTTAALNKKFKLSITVGKVRGITRNYKMKSGRTGQFTKGGESWNAGKKGLTKSNVTSFKKGNKPYNWTPVGTERLTSGDKYIKVKTAEPNVWKFKHRLIWEKANGPIPKDHTIVFRDGDRNNCNLKNLELIDRGVLVQYNKKQGSKLPPELRQSARTIAAIKVTAGRRARNS